MQIVAAFGELILSRTETPGARDAKAHEHVYLVLSEETAEVQRAVTECLAFVERARITPRRFSDAQVRATEFASFGNGRLEHGRVGAERIVFAY